jgi:hypothetical protein
MKRQAMLAVTTLLVVGGSGCALTAPFKNGGPSVSHEGVQVAVTRQRCDQEDESDWYGEDLVEAILEIEVRNATPAQLTVHRDAFRLLGPEGIALRPQTWRSADPMTIDGGATGTFELRFMSRGGLECRGEMLLDADDGLALPAGPVKVGSVKFVPSRA